MRVLPLLLVLAATGTGRSEAQAVMADIHIAGGPLYGRVVIGHPYRPYPVHAVIAPYAHYPFHAVVVRHGPPGRVKRYHRAVIWYHPTSGHYYQHHHPGLRGLREVHVREANGQYWFDS
jgi:hypothetical protein